MYDGVVGRNIFWSTAHAMSCAVRTMLRLSNIKKKSCVCFWPYIFHIFTTSKPFRKTNPTGSSVAAHQTSSKKRIPRPHSSLFAPTFIQLGFFTYKMWSFKSNGIQLSILYIYNILGQSLINICNYLLLLNICWCFYLILRLLFKDLCLIRWDIWIGK